jgi:hypothetical protein
LPITAKIRRASPAWWLAGALAIVFLLGHLPFLASTLEDLDSVNFALGLRDFDPVRHRPHPPGYPIYMALGKAANLAMSEPAALAIWGALFGAISAFSLLQLFKSLDRLDLPADQELPPRPGLSETLTSPAVAATLLTMASPLFYFTASRPMSDMAGLSAALGVQAVLVTAVVRQRRPVTGLVRGAFDSEVAASSGRVILLGAFMAALAIGMRSQAAWLTLPLLVLVLFDRAGRGAAGALIGSAVWFIFGALLWAVPLVVATGGPVAYWQALTAQGGEDIGGVDLLVTNFGARRAAFGLLDSFLHPWAVNGLGVVVLVLAGAGGLLMLWRSRRPLVVLLVAFLPYTIFHLFFHETVITRYALPLVPMVVYLAVRALYLAGRKAGAALTLALAIVCLAIVVPALAQYASSGSPVAHTMADVRAAAEIEKGAVLGMHHAFKRSAEAELGDAGFVLPSVPKHEWLSLVKYWIDGGTGPAWFLEDPRRTDLALVDPRSRVVRKAYRWPFSSREFLSGIRPNEIDWVEMREPGWFAAEGWDLTPETAGVARLDKRSLDHGPIAAWVRRRDGPVTMMIGGRHLGKAGDPVVHFIVSIDGRSVETWDVPPTSPFFMRFASLPSGVLAGAGRFARLEVAATTSDGVARVNAAIEQFDLQAPDVPILGFDAGWYEPEYNPSQGRMWRWAGARAEARLSVAADVTLEIAGESPLRYFGKPPHVVVRVGDTVVHRDEPRDDFTWRVAISRQALELARGIVTIETDETYRPVDRGENQDPRSLGLRVYRCRIVPQP